VLRGHHQGIGLNQVKKELVNFRQGVRARRSALGIDKKLG
jgi:hypothetical protein